MPAQLLAIGTSNRIKLRTNAEEVESAMDTDQINYSKAIDVSFCPT